MDTPLFARTGYFQILQGSIKRFAVPLQQLLWAVQQQAIHLTHAKSRSDAATCSLTNVYVGAPIRHGWQFSHQLDSWMPTSPKQVSLSP